MLSQVFIAKPVVLLEMEHDVRVALSEPVGILKIVDLLQYDSEDAHVVTIQLSMRD